MFTNPLFRWLCAVLPFVLVIVTTSGSLWAQTPPAGWPYDFSMGAPDSQAYTMNYGGPDGDVHRYDAAGADPFSGWAWMFRVNSAGTSGTVDGVHFGEEMQEMLYSAPFTVVDGSTVFGAPTSDPWEFGSPGNFPLPVPGSYSVPEPTAAAILAPCLLALLWRRRSMRSCGNSR